MPRIAPLEPPFDASTQELLTKMMPPGAAVPPLAVFRTLARLPKTGKRLAGVGGALLGSGTLPIATRELVVLRTTARCGAEYEWGVHATWLGEAAGLSAGQLDDVCRTPIDPALWSEQQRHVLGAADELHERGTLTGETFDALRVFLEPDGVLELLVVAGFYHLISFVVNGAGLDREPWAARFPSRS